MAFYVNIGHTSANGTKWAWDFGLNTYVIVGYTDAHPVYGMDEGL